MKFCALWITRCGLVETIKLLLLLGAGADINAQDQNGGTRFIEPCEIA